MVHNSHGYPLCVRVNSYSYICTVHIRTSYRYRVTRSRYFVSYVCIRTRVYIRSTSCTNGNRELVKQQPPSHLVNIQSFLYYANRHVRSMCATASCHDHVVRSRHDSLCRPVPIPSHHARLAFRLHAKHHPPPTRRIACLNNTNRLSPSVLAPPPALLQESIVDASHHPPPAVSR